MASDHEYITEYGHDVVGLFNSCIFEAVIVSVDYDNDKADINITNPVLGLYSDVSVFYHCAGSTEVEGGSAAFDIDDHVIVFGRNCKDSLFPGSAMKIVGFVDGLKSCAIRIKLYRGDGVLITGWSGGGNPGDILNGLALRNSDDDWISQTVTYDSETEYWTLSVDNDEDKDPNGYWIVWQCSHGRPGNYPYRYFPVWDAVGAITNLRQEEDLIKGGSYVDIIPYFDHTDYSDPGDNCDTGNPGFQVDSQKWVEASSSVAFYIRYRIPARPSVAGLAINCQGREWELSCSEFSYTIPADGIIPNEISAFALKPINVQISNAIAEEIAIELSSTEDPDWDKFNAQFPSISIGSGGVSSDNFYVDFIEGGDYDIARNTFSDPIPYTLQF